MPELYDPGVPEYEVLPDGPCDGVYSTDVMEHIPKEQIPETFNIIFSKAERFVFLAICTRPSIAVLPNGENAHVLIRNPLWWKGLIDSMSLK